MVAAEEMVGDALSISVCATEGGRKYMEDRVDLHRELNPDGSIAWTYLGVFDGHGGAEASAYARANLLRAITSQAEWEADEDGPILAAIRAGFLACHAGMRKVVHSWARTASGFPSTAGTTASVAFIRKGKLYTGHVGDSAIVLAHAPSTSAATPSVTAITADHKPESPEELKRIREAGGQVQSKSGVMRVVWRRPLRGHTGPVRRSTQQETIPFLAVARALGDLWSYNEDTQAFVVSPDPDVDVMELRQPSSLILGSDGLWNVVKPSTAAEIVSVAANPAHALVASALRGWGHLRADNISAIVATFGAELHSEPILSASAEDSLDLYSILETNPTAVARLFTDGSAQITASVTERLRYTGTMDPQLVHLLERPPRIGAFVGFSGPGFVDYEYGRHADSLPPPLPTPPPPLIDENRNEMDLGASFARGTLPALAHVNAKDTTVSHPSPGVRISRRPLAKTSPPSPKLPSPVKEDGDANANNQPETPTAEEETKTRAKYVCRKHGYTCEKVRRMNAEWERKRRAEEASEEEGPAPPQPSKKPRLETATPSVAASGRATRSGLPLSPIKSRLRPRGPATPKTVPKPSGPISSRLRGSGRSGSGEELSRSLPALRTRSRLSSASPKATAAKPQALPPLRRGKRSLAATEAKPATAAPKAKRRFWSSLISHLWPASAGNADDAPPPKPSLSGH